MSTRSNEAEPTSGSKTKQPLLHVRRQLGQWTIIPDGETRGEEQYRTRDEAIARGRALARELGADLVLHNQHGEVEGREVHRRDESDRGGAAFHVFDHPDGWTVQNGDPDADDTVFDTKKEAVQHAKDLAREQGGELFIHRKDGRVSTQHSYGTE